MNTDELLEAMVREASIDAEGAENDPRWLAMAEGTLTDDERLELSALADRSDTARRAYDLLQPLDAVTRERIIERVARLQQARLMADTSFEPGGQRRRSWLRWGSALAAAAMLMLWLWSGIGSDPLPSYAFGEVWVDGSHMRSAVPADSADRKPLVLRVGRGERFKVELRPDTAVTGEVAVRVFEVREQNFKRLKLESTATSDGFLQIVGNVDEQLPLDAGHSTLVFAIGRPASLPTTEEQVRDAVDSSSQPDGWQLLIQEVVVESENDR